MLSYYESEILSNALIKSVGSKAVAKQELLLTNWALGSVSHAYKRSRITQLVLTALNVGKHATARGPGGAVLLNFLITFVDFLSF